MSFERCSRPRGAWCQVLAELGSSLTIRASSNDGTDAVWKLADLWSLPFWDLPKLNFHVEQMANG